MASMFSKDEEGSGTTKQHDGGTGTVIGSTVRVEGTFTSDEDILVEGHVIGTLTTTQDLTVGENATIEANVTANNMHVAGSVTGNLQATGTVTLTSSARVLGDVETSIISVETGAVIQGRCITGAPESAPTSTDEAVEGDSEQSSSDE